MANMLMRACVIAVAVGVVNVAAAEEPDMEMIVKSAGVAPVSFELGEVLYANPLSSPADIAEFRVEGDAALTFPRGCLRMENSRPPEKGRHANFIFWCTRDFPADIALSWNFRPITDAGLAMVWVGARGQNGEDLFDPSLAPRDGNYPQYHHGDINALHVSYHRNPVAGRFQVCNVRKSYGFHMVAQGADPIPGRGEAPEPFRMRLIKCGPRVVFFINDLQILHWVDDGETYGPVIGGGKIGFRQMAYLIAEYSDLEVRAVRLVP